MTTNASRALPTFLVDQLDHAVEVLKAAHAARLPMPEQVEATDAQVRLHVTNLGELCDWSLWFESPIHTTELHSMRKAFHTVTGEVAGRRVLVCLTEYGVPS